MLVERVAKKVVTQLRGRTYSCKGGKTTLCWNVQLKRWEHSVEALATVPGFYDSKSLVELSVNVLRNH